MQEKRKQAIHTAKQQWEMMQSTMMGKSNRLTKMPEIYANHVATYDNPRPTSDVIDEDTDDQGYVMLCCLIQLRISAINVHVGVNYAMT